MRLLTLAATLSILACQYETETLPNPADEEECVTTRSSDSRPVVKASTSYHSQMNPRQMAVGMIAGGAYWRDMIFLLTRLLKIYRENYPTVMHLSETEMRQLKSDNEVMIIEPDRVVAINACFKVLAPKLVIWNIAKTGYGDGTDKTAWIVDTGIDADHPILTLTKTEAAPILKDNLP